MKINKLVAIFSLTILLTTSCKNKTQTKENNKVAIIDSREMKNMIKIKSDMNIDINRIFPRIKANYGHAIYKNDSSKKFLGNSDFKLDLPKKFTPINVELFEDINLTFIADKGGSYQMLQQEVFDLNPDITIDSLQSTSIRNLMAEIGDKIEMSGDVDDLAMLTCGGNFEATIIFISGTWDHLFKLFGSEIAFCLPANDILYVCKADNKVAISKMKSQINSWFHGEDTQGLISKGIFLKVKDVKGVKMIDTAF